MNENLNLVEILRDCPGGTKLYCTIFGDVTFEGIYDDEDLDDLDDLDLPIKIRTTDGDLESLSINGQYYASREGECILFPSKENRDWSTFKVPVKRFKTTEFQPFDKVLCRQNISNKWDCEFFSEFLYPVGDYPCVRVTGRALYYQCIPYNNRTAHLVGTDDDCPDYYKWWEE